MNSLDAQLDFEKGDGLIPAIVQDEQSAKVLMLGYMNREALEKTVESGKVTFFSRSKSRLWTKGESSGNFLLCKSIHADCDKDTLLIKAEPVGPVCHTGADTCFFEENKPNAFFLEFLSSVIKQRKEEGSTKSYTASLLKMETAKVAQKVGEEGVETVIEAMKGDKERLREESADLLFHLLVLLEKCDTNFSEVMEVLHKRHQ